MALGGFLVRNKGLIANRLISRPWLMLHPDMLPKILRGVGILIRFSRQKDSTTKPPSITEVSHFGILAIATEPTMRGLGVGRLLMDQSEQYAREQNFKKMYLSVDPKNSNAIQFYEQIGWEKEGDIENWAGGMKKNLIPDVYD